jgi:hypothetical protein
VNIGGSWTVTACVAGLAHLSDHEEYSWFFLSETRNAEFPVDSANSCCVMRNYRAGSGPRSHQREPGKPAAGLCLGMLDSTRPPGAFRHLGPSRKPPPCFTVRNANGQALACVYSEDEPGRGCDGQAADPQRGAAHGGELPAAAEGLAKKAVNLFHCASRDGTFKAFIIPQHAQSFDAQALSRVCRMRHAAAGEVNESLMPCTAPRSKYA